MPPRPPRSTLFPYTTLFRSLGAFFRNAGMQREEKELLMIVTPRLVNPLAANAPQPELPGEALRTYDPSALQMLDRKSTRLNSSHVRISYAVFCLKKKKE